MCLKETKKNDYEKLQKETYADVDDLTALVENVHNWTIDHSTSSAVTRDLRWTATHYYKVKVS